MSLLAFEGAAGTGKTHQLMGELRATVEGTPLGLSQRVLALTFMHGSRRRLDDRLRSIRSLRGRYTSTTFDHFAWEICRRWRTLLRVLGYADFEAGQYEEVCTAAGQLLSRDDVITWTAARFPVVVVDEAQDLTQGRLGMVQALETKTRLLIAADEFQCLSVDLRVNPAVEWLRRRTNPTIFAAPRRTQRQELLDAAAAIRGRREVLGGQRVFRRFAAPARGRNNPLAATFLANAVAWGQTPNVVVLTPTKEGGFATSVLDLVRARPHGQQQNGPYDFQWEFSEREALSAIVQDIALPENGDIQAIRYALREKLDNAIVGFCLRQMERQVALGVRDRFDVACVHAMLEDAANICRRYGSHREAGLRAMTIHQAKNREFDGVIVLWPFRAGGDAELKRRLLYNAVTRAKQWCTVIVQNDQLFEVPPFAAAVPNA